MLRARFEGLLGDVRVRVFWKEPALRITGLLILALGGKGIATGVAVVVVVVDKCEVVTGRKNRLP
jgi:hypothetical protein